MSEGHIHQVAAGECVTSIAHDHGLFWQTVWDHPNNAALREQRADPNVLQPGDELFVPARQPGRFVGQTDARHVFKRRGVPVQVVLRILDHDDRPRAGLGYRFVCNHRTREGTVADDGQICEYVDPQARSATLTLHGASGDECYRLELGGVDPIDEVRGLQLRLRNLGLDPGPLDGEPGEQTRAALREFQARHGLNETGVLDRETRGALLDAHGC